MGTGHDWKGRDGFIKRWDSLIAKLSLFKYKLDLRLFLIDIFGVDVALWKSKKM